MGKTHAQRCAEIALWAANDWLKPAQAGVVHPEDLITCQECGRSFVGNRRRVVCSHECKDKRDNRAAHERMKARRAQNGTD